MLPGSRCRGLSRAARVAGRRAGADSYTGTVSVPAKAAREEQDRAAADRLQREWWRNVVLVLRDPKPVFRAMRDDSRPAAEARVGAVLAILLLAGIASVLSFSATSREFLDEPGVDGALVPVLAFLGGAVYGFAGYWLGGLALHLGVRGAKGEGTYRQAQARARVRARAARAVARRRLAAPGCDLRQRRLPLGWLGRGRRLLGVHYRLARLSRLVARPPRGRSPRAARLDDGARRSERCS